MLNLENDIVTPLKPKFNVRYGDDMFKTTKVIKRNIFFRKIDQLLSKNYAYYCPFNETKKILRYQVNFC